MTTLTLRPSAKWQPLYPGATTFPGASTFPSASGMSMSPAATGTLTLTPVS